MRNFETDIQSTKQVQDDQDMDIAFKLYNMIDSKLEKAVPYLFKFILLYMIAHIILLAILL